jgi:hypothetical protein
MRQTIKWAALIWAICGVLTSAQLVYAENGPLWLKGTMLPVCIVAWPWRAYVVITRPAPIPVKVLD